MAFNLVSHKYKYLIISFQKSGCSTIKNLFINLHFHEFNWLDKTQILNKGESAFNYNDYDFMWEWALKINDDNYKKLLNSYNKFIIARNSYERTVSLYFNRFLNISSDNLENTNFKIQKSTTFNQFLNEVYHNKFENDWHYEKQIFPNILENVYVINLNHLSETLEACYKKFANLSNKKMKIVKKCLNLNSKNIIKKRKNIDPNIKLDNYDFKADHLGLDILKNGIPSFKNMLSEENCKLIKEIWKDEISIYNWDHKHLI
tara:strand:- start:542 stop:1321 length:780 start_codon:yes stop_codon:yes gene_type:complete